MNDLVCSYYETHSCRSCTMLRFDNEATYKSGKAKLLTPIVSNLSKEVRVEPFIFSDTLFSSRSKAKLAITGTLSDPCIGLVQFDGENLESSELLECPLHMAQINSVLPLLKEVITEFKLTPYDIKAKKGELKGVIIKISHDASQAILRFIVRSSESVPRIRKAIPKIQRTFPFIKVVSANIQNIPHAVLEGPEETILTAQQYIEESYGEVSLLFGPQSFSQVTHSTALKLYQTVAQLTASVGSKRMLDLFCGVGGFSLLAAHNLHSVQGVELSEDAVHAASMAASKSKITNASFECKDVFEFLKSSTINFDTVITNPPRRGLGNELLSLLPGTGAKHFIYSSCNPITFLKDYETLKENFALRSIQPFDMFPLTEHIELLGYFESKSK